MTVAVTWPDILMRLVIALLCGAAIGADRTMRGRIAGLRTTMLMCLAACGAMIEANLTLAVSGKTASSFAMMDSLRFPLGILSGIGFIGAGAIVRRGNMVTGVTTAATLWLITVVGLLLGAGYLLVGVVTTGLAYGVLTLLKSVEPRLKREHRSHLVLRIEDDAPSIDEIRKMILAAGYKITSLSITCDGWRRLELHLEWYSRREQDHLPAAIQELSNINGLTCMEWTPVSAGHVFE